MVEDTTKPQEDVDAAFKDTVTRALTKLEVKEVPEKPTLDDENKTFRTRLVALWMLSNASLAIAIENINGVENPATAAEDLLRLRRKQNTYFAIILFSTFGLAAVRFAGVSRDCHRVRVLLRHVLYSVSSTSSSATCSVSAGGIERALTAAVGIHGIQQILDPWTIVSFSVSSTHLKRMYEISGSTIKFEYEIPSS